MKTIHVSSLSDLPRAAEAIIELFDEKKVFAFYGEMGAGKTTLIKTVCRILQVRDYATSPTFSLVNEYHTPDDRTIFHFDFYRINSVEELYDIGYEEYVYSGEVCFIEWPAKAESLIPEDAAKIEITVNPDDSRSIKIVSE